MSEMRRRYRDTENPPGENVLRMQQLADLQLCRLEEGRHQVNTTNTTNNPINKYYQ